MGDNPFEEPSSNNQRLLNTGGSRSYGGSGGYQPREVFGDAYVDTEGGNETFKPELQFQNFQHTSAPPAGGRGTISNSGHGAVIQPEESAVVDFEDDPTGKQPLASGSGGSGGSGGEGNPPPPPPEPIPTGSARFWSVEFYRPLFNVDTKEVLQRLLRSLMPFRFGFIETAKTNPDFYGPFWIATTLIFLLAMAGNLYAQLNDFLHGGNGGNGDSSSSEAPTSGPTAEPTAGPTAAALANLLGATASSSSDEGWSYNFFVIVVGACVIYGYVIVIPLILWGVFKYLSVPVKLLEVICIYGYTLFIFIPVSVICVIPSNLLQWVVTGVACLWSGFFLVSNLLVTVKDIALKRGLVAMLVVGALHIALGLTYKLYFFDHAYSK